MNCKDPAHLARNGEATPVVSLLYYGPDGFHGFHEPPEFVRGEVAYPGYRPGWHHEYIL